MGKLWERRGRLASWHPDTGRWSGELGYERTALLTSAQQEGMGMDGVCSDDCRRSG